MGGHALASLHPIRLTTPEMLSCDDGIRASWIRHGNAHISYRVLWAAPTADHGDMDLGVS